MSLSSDHYGRRMGIVPGNKYPNEEREGRGTNVGGCRRLCFPISFFLLPEAFKTLSAFPLVAGIPHEVCFLGLPHSGENWGGSGSVVSRRKQAYSLNESLWIFKSLEIPVSWCILAAMSDNSEDITGASLVAQWLRICLSMQGTRVRALVWEDPTCRGATGPVSHNYWACASGACAPQQERPR